MVSPARHGRSRGVYCFGFSGLLISGSCLTCGMTPLCPSWSARVSVPDADEELQRLIKVKDATGAHDEPLHERGSIADRQVLYQGTAFSMRHRLAVSVLARS